MTISTENNRNTYTGDGSTVLFAYNFRILEQTHLLVQIKDTTTGIITTKTISADYTVSGVGISSGGSITFTTAPASTDEIIIVRDVPFTQEVDLVEGDKFPVDAIENAIDKLTMLNQQLKEQSDRVLSFDATVSESFNSIMPNPVANNILRVSGDGLSLLWDTISSGGMTALLDDLTPQLYSTLDTNSNNIQIGSTYGIVDENSNEQIIFTTTSGAVNYINITNNTTSNAPIIQAQGSDTNISLSIGGKGTGEVKVLSNLDLTTGLLRIEGTSSAGGVIRLYEDTDNGTNYVSLQCPSSVSSNTNFVLPSSDGTSGQFLKTDGSGNLGFETVTVTNDMELIATATASNDASIEFTDLGDSTYQYYVVVLVNVAPTTDNVTMYLRFSTDNGSSFIAGATSYRIASLEIQDNSDVLVNRRSTGINRILDLQSCGNGSAEGTSGEVMLFNPNASGKNYCCAYRFIKTNSAGDNDFLHGGGRLTGTVAVVNAIQFIFNSGNISTGEFRLYGIRGS